MNKGSLDELLRYCKSAVPAAEIVFTANPGKVLFGENPKALNSFIRAICYKTYTLQHDSEDWRTFIDDLKKVT